MSARKTGSDETSSALAPTSRTDASTLKPSLTPAAEAITHPRMYSGEAMVLAMDPSSPMPPLDPPTDRSGVASIPDRGLSFVLVEARTTGEICEVADRGLYFTDPTASPTLPTEAEVANAPHPIEPRRKPRRMLPGRVDWSSLLEALRDRSTHLGEFAADEVGHSRPSSEKRASA